MCEIRTQTRIPSEDLWEGAEEDIAWDASKLVPCEDEYTEFYLVWYVDEYVKHQIRAERVTTNSFGEKVHLSWSEWSDDAVKTTSR